MVNMLLVYPSAVMGETLLLWYCVRICKSLYGLIGKGCHVMLPHPPVPFLSHPVPSHLLAHKAQSQYKCYYSQEVKSVGFGLNPLHFVFAALHSVRLHLNTGTHTLAHLIPSSPRMPVLFWLVRNVSVFLTSKSILFCPAPRGPIYSG